MRKATHIIKTNSYHSDGRLLKWISSLRDNDISSDVIILENENTRSFRKENDVHITTQSLFSRRFFKQRSGYFMKVPEYCLKLLRPISKSNSDIIIFQDVQHYLNILSLLLFRFSKDKIIVWDLHEVPHSIFFKYPFARQVLKFILESIDVVVYTNEERREYIYSKLKMEEKNYFILNNYPEKGFLTASHHSLPESLNTLRESLPYILWLGNGIKQRHFGVFLEAFEKVNHKYNLVILGKIDPTYESKVNSYVASNIGYNAFVKQDEMIAYIDNALFSIVLYDSTTINSFYCEPNRLYQLLCRNIPSIVGNNPTMKNVIENYNAGIVLEDDGSNVALLNKAIEDLEDFETFRGIKKNLHNPIIKDVINWDVQFKGLALILNKISKK